MASALRSLIPSSSRRVGTVTWTLRPSSLATSSRVGLDFTLPRFSSTTTESPVEAAAQPAPSHEGSPFSPSPSPSVSTAPPSSRPTPTPKPTPSLASALSSSTSSSRPRKSDKSFRWAPLDIPTYKDPLSDTRREPVSSPTHLLTISSTRNNVLLTFSDQLGPLFPTITAGSGKSFKGAARSSYEAAHQAALKMFKKIDEYAMDWASYRPTPSTSRESGFQSAMNQKERKKFGLLVAYSGVFGQGREAVHSALSGPEGAEIRRMVIRVEDRTPIKIGGTRARRPRRL